MKQYLYIYIFTQCNTRSIFKQSEIVLNYGFSLSERVVISRLKKTQSALLFNQSGKKMKRWIYAFQSEMQTALSRIWTLVTNSIEYDNNIKLSK